MLLNTPGQDCPALSKGRPQLRKSGKPVLIACEPRTSSLHPPDVPRTNSQNSFARQHIRKTFTELGHALQCAAVDPRKKTVHHLRTNTRRLESFIQNCLPRDAEKKLQRKLKKLRQLAGEVRDVDVLTNLVADMQSVESARGRAFVTAKLDLMRAENEKVLLEQLSPRLLEKLNGMLKVCERNLLASVAKGSERHDPLDTALQQYVDLTRRLEPLGRHNLHEFRKACKQVRYLAELGAADTDKEKAVEQLTKIQDSVGDWHDLLILDDIARRRIETPQAFRFR